VRCKCLVSIPVQVDAYVQGSLSKARLEFIFGCGVLLVEKEDFPLKDLR